MPSRVDGLYDARRQINIVEPLALNNVYVITDGVELAEPPQNNSTSKTRRFAIIFLDHGGFELSTPCRAPTISHFEVYGASLVATIASHAQGTWIVRIRRAQSLDSGLHSTEGMAPGNVQLQD